MSVSAPVHVSATARRYARALIQVAVAARTEKTVLAEIEAVVAALAENPAARRALEAPGAGRRQQAALEEVGVRGNLSQPVRRLLAVLLEEGRFRLLPELAVAYGREVDAYHDVVEVDVSVAQALDAEEEKALRGALERVLAGGRQVRLRVTVEPKLVAGLVARIGSVVHDGSLVRQLELARRQLVAG